MISTYQITRLSLRNELLEALDWDEDALSEVMKDCDDALSQITKVSEAGSALQRLRTELSLSRGEDVAKIAITYYLHSLNEKPTKEISA